MKFSDLRFAQKLGLGFGALIMISIILGAIAVVNMQKISTKSGHLAHEYVPEVEIANNIERYALLTMFEMRGYSFSEEDSYLNKGQGHLNELKGYLKDAEQLADESTQLVKLRGAIDDVTQAVNTYESLGNKTIETNNHLAELRNNMDESAAAFMQNCADYLDSQNESFRREASSGIKGVRLEERHSKITLINDIIDKGNEMRVANFKAQATRSPQLVQEAYNNFDIDYELKELRAVTRLEADKLALNNIESAANKYTGAMEDFLLTWKARENFNVDRVAAANIVLDGSKEMALAGVNNTNDIANEAVTMLGASSLVMVVGLIIAIILGIILAVVLTRSVTTGLKRSVQFAEQVASGDLTTDLEEEYLHRKDEIGTLSKSLSNMVGKLREIVESILNGSESIASASQQMASTSQEMSQSASEQASSVEEVSSSMEEMVSNIQQNADNSQQTEKIASNAAVGIREGSEATNTAVTSMKNIADKIRIINDIAFQTNILALNAAVEAARAGEHGKGFAVVAAEVRKLAERSKVAADEIDDLSKNGVAVAEKAGTKLNEIVPEIEKTAKLVQEISAASIEQNNGADQVNNAVQQVNNATQQNAAASEEIATSSEELASQAESLKDIINYFVINRGKRAVKSTAPKKSKLNEFSESYGGNGSQKSSNEKEKKGANIYMSEPATSDNEFETM